jgi:hypothetical protein
MENANENQATNETASTEETSKKRPKKVINYEDTLFEVSQDTLDQLLARIDDHHTATGTGIPCAVLASEFCGDEKFREVIVYAVEKYLADDVESIQGVGFCMKGRERLVGQKAPSEPPSPEVMAEVTKFVDEHFNGGVKSVSVDNLLLKAAFQGKLPQVNGTPDDSLWRAGIQALGTATDSQYEIQRGAGLRRKAAPAATAS